MISPIIQAHLDLLDCCNAPHEEETVFAQAQENMTAEEFSEFTTLCPLPISKRTKKFEQNDAQARTAIAAKFHMVSDIAAEAKPSWKRGEYYMRLAMIREVLRQAEKLVDDLEPQSQGE